MVNVAEDSNHIRYLQIRNKPTGPVCEKKIYISTKITSVLCLGLEYRFKITISLPLLQRAEMICVFSTSIDASQGGKDLFYQSVKPHCSSLEMTERS